MATRHDTRLWNALDQSRAERDSLRAERDALKQTVHDELDANLRLREIGGAQPDEGMTTFLERVFSERDSLRAELAAVLAPHTVVHEVLVEQLGEKGAAAVTHAARAHVAALEALHAEVERLKQERDTFYMDYRMKCDAQTKSLHAEVERLRKDAERSVGKTAARCREMAMWPQSIDDEQAYYGSMFAEFITKEFGAAIDAAMRQEGGG